jgi:hypothetical protein
MSFSYEDDDFDLGLDLGNIEPAQDFSPIPAGTYNLIPVEFVLKDTKDGTGKYINARFDVADGQYAGKPIFEKINTNNRSETAVSIGKKTLVSLLSAVGINTNQPTTMGLIRSTIGKRVSAKVAVEQDKSGQYAAQNRIKAILPASNSPAPQASPRQQQRAPVTVPPQPATNGERAPWER